MTIIASADGSALGNPGPAGWAWYVDDDHWAAGGWDHSTNNRGELQAVLELLQATADRDEPLRILCDSKYVINSVTKWMPGWKRKGWKKSDGKPVLNRDQLELIDAALQGRDVRFEWIKGHAGHHMNEAADERAHGAALAIQAGRAVDAGPGFAASAATPSITDASSEATSSSSTAPDALTAERLLADARGSRDLATGRDLLDEGCRIIGSRALLPAAGDQLRSAAASAVTDDVAIVTYETRSPTVAAHSSVWVRRNGRWLLRLHQVSPGGLA
ncbi:ribonuclease H family protein [Pseudoclavibacter sp. 13-3]|uniref:ribonuclease H family protein n=1 Tax=Pseudoclavibacter sp. 13-3 TaxID=2901228 RepID=UPI001E3A7D7E|nr:ribonuclease H [Pseudoclavibacter sp. 13-3]MCD7101043.1 ribonuclease HI [Pseudoclavibacter sp. 13-3]